MSSDTLGAVLAAIANLEGWDAEHPSVAMNKENGWKIDKYGNPVPTDELIKMVNIEIRRVKGQKKYGG